MRSFLPLVVLTALTLTVFAAAQGHDTQESVDPLPNSGGPACNLSATEFKLLMQMPYDTFDQDFKTGFRAVAHRSCELTAAMLLDSYVLNMPDRTTAIQRGNLLFHAGQLYAYSGLNDLAVTRMLQSLQLHPDAGQEVAWNPYVLASVAFLQHDRAALMSQGQALTAARASVGNTLNAKVVDRFIRCFDRPYREAYESCPVAATRQSK